MREEETDRERGGEKERECVKVHGRERVQVIETEA